MDVFGSFLNRKQKIHEKELSKEDEKLHWREVRDAKKAELRSYCGPSQSSQGVLALCTYPRAAPSSEIRPASMLPSEGQLATRTRKSRPRRASTRGKGLGELGTCRA